MNANSSSPPVAVRPMRPADAPAVAALVNASCRHLWTVTPAEVLGQSGFRLVAVTEDGTALASVRLAPFGPGAEDAQRLHLCGDAAQFSALYLSALSLSALSRADLKGYMRVLSVVREDWHEQVHFLQAAGFANVWQSFGAHLDLGAFDLSRFEPLLRQVYLRGYEVREWTPSQGAGSGQTGALDELYALHQHFADAPATPATHPQIQTRDDFAASLGVGQRRTWVLWRGAEAAAYTSFQFPGGQPDSSSTVTRRDLRGQGLALALKAHALDALRSEGFTEASTGGAAANLPMLRVNLKLGFRAEPLWLTFERSLTPAQADARSGHS